jgi:hypothetical protein
MIRYIDRIDAVIWTSQQADRPGSQLAHEECLEKAVEHAMH